MITGMGNQQNGQADMVAVSQAPVPVKPPRAIQGKLRPFFWSKLPWRPDIIWARVHPGSLTEQQLAALEALFAQTAPSPQARAASSRTGVPPGCACTRQQQDLYTLFVARYTSSPVHVFKHLVIE
jgi:hypothetical protein